MVTARDELLPFSICDPGERLSRQRSGLCLPIVILASILLHGMPGLAADTASYGQLQPAYAQRNQSLANLADTDRGQFSLLFRCRLQPVFDLGQSTKLIFAYEAAGLLYTAAPLLAETVATGARQLVRLHWRPLSGDRHSIRHGVERFYLAHHEAGWQLSVGRRQFDWSVGTFWHPVDFFLPPDPTDFSRPEQEGADVVALSARLSDSLGIDLVLNPVQRHSFNGLVRMSLISGYWQAALQAGRVEDRFAAGAVLEQSLDNVRAYCEAAYHGPAIGERGFARLLLGLHIESNDERNRGALEYHFNGEGPTDHSEYDLLRLFRNEIINLGQHYLAARIWHRFNAASRVQADNVLNLVDGSGLFHIWSDYMFAPSLTLRAGVQVPYARSLREYWYYARSVYLALRAYF